MNLRGGNTTGAIDRARAGKAGSSADETTSPLMRNRKGRAKALDRLAQSPHHIGHRAPPVDRACADKILVMDRARLFDEDRHDELLTRVGIYADLHALQFKTSGPSADTRAQAAADQRRKENAKAKSGSGPRGEGSLLSRIFGRWF